jgi:hypothetical protein
MSRRRDTQTNESAADAPPEGHGEAGGEGDARIAPKRPHTGDVDREARRAKALRANLRKRKTQQRARQSPESEA